MNRKTSFLRLTVLVAAMMCALGATAQQAYACYTPANTTLTFYYDNLRASRPGTTYLLFSGTPGWYDIRTSVTKVEFDPTFADARPTSAHYWFYEMTNLTTISGLNYLNTENMIDMNGMFAYCSSLTSIDVGHFNTDNSEDMGGMFFGCSGVSSLDVSHFNTSKVTNMGAMFQNCSGLTVLDLGSFNINKVQSLSYMFSGCSNLTTIYVGGGWFVSDSTPSSDFSCMFSGCTSLVGGQGTRYHASSSSMPDIYYAVADNPSAGMPGYMTGKCYVIYDPDNTTLTFYYDYLANTRQGIVYYPIWYLANPDWYRDNTAKSVTQVVFDPSFAEVRPTSTFGWFYGMDHLSSLSGMEYLNTEDVTNMKSMFNGCSALTSLDLSTFYTPNLQIIDKMFYGCYNLTTIYASDLWTTQSVNYGTEVFYGCGRLVGDKGTTYNNIYEDYVYAHLDGGPSDPGYFSVVPQTQAYACYTPDNTTLTFYYDNQRNSREGTTYDLNEGTLTPSWYTDGTSFSVTQVVFDPSFAEARPTSTYKWFGGMTRLTTITDMGQYLNTEDVTVMSEMFYSCSSLTSLDVSSFNTSNVTDMASMFNGCSGFTSLDLSSFNTSNVTDMNRMFYACSALNINLSSFNTSSVTNMADMFSDCSVESLDLSSFNTSNVTDMGSMFDNCCNLTSLDLSSFNTENLEAMGYMFRGCSSLTELNLSSFNTTKVERFFSTFRDCESLETLDLGSFNTENVVGIYSMFKGCSNLKNLNLSSFNTSNVTTMTEVFDGCTSLTSLDLSSFNTANLINMPRMFNGCESLATIYVGEGWSTAAVEFSFDMFLGCTSLVGGMGTTYDENHVDAEYAHIDGGPSNPGYFTEKPAFLRGDVDGDTHVDINDVTKLIGVVLGTTTDYNSAAADCDVAGGSGSVDINDVTALLNFVLNGHWN